MPLVKRFLTRIGALAAVAGAALPLLAQSGGPAPVRVAVVQERTIAPQQQFVGTVMPLRKVVVGSAVGGRIAEFPIEQGQRVEARATLAELLKETITQELAAAQAELELRQAELAELKNGTREEEKRQARARMDAAQARMEYAKSRLQRFQSLARQGLAVSNEELDEAISAAEAAASAYREAVAGWELAEAGPRPEQIAQAEARVRMQQAVVARLEDQKSKHTIRTHFAGYISAEFTEAGAWVNPGDPVAEIVALDTVEIEVQVVENHIPYVLPGGEALVTLSALPEREFRGTVASVVPQADPRSRTFPVRVRVENEFETAEGGQPLPVIKAGMLARVWLPVGSRQIGPVAPKDALVFNLAQKTIWVIDPQTVKRVNVGGAPHFQGEAQNVVVQPGVEDATSVLIPQGVKPGQYVVIEGNERIRPAGPGKPAMVQWPAGDAAAESGGRRAESRSE